MAEEKARQKLVRERWALLREVNEFLDKPMIALSFVWLVLMVLDLTEGLSPALTHVFNIIWVLFVVDFSIELWIAPHWSSYLRKNWLTAISILLPAFRVLRLFRVFQAVRLARFGRSLSLIRLLASVRRGMKLINLTLARRGFGYVLALSLIVIFVGSAGMAYFESGQALQEAGIRGVTGLNSYGEALWWTAMIMTTMGSDYWPKTLEGRILGWLIAMYAFTVFGYITATLASMFIQTDRAPVRPK